MSMLIEEAVLPALERLEWRHLQMPESPTLVVPLAGPAPAATAFLLTIETNEELGEILFHAGLCIAPAARRAPVALLLAGLNTRYRFATFSMSQEGEVRLDVGVDLIGVTPEMCTVRAELGLRRLAHALWETCDEVMQAATGRGKRRPRVEREVNEVLRKLER